MSSLSLVQSCLWTVTRCVPLVPLGSPIVSLFKEEIEQGWVNSCAVIKVRSFCCARGTHRVTVQRQDWTRLSELILLTFITAHEFTQPCSIFSLNSDTICAPSAAETSYLYHSTWVHSALFNLLFEQWHDGWPWTRLSELICCDKGQKFLLH
jgi:hypothetical protein